MINNEDFSDEILNAFIDDELSHDERTQILSALRQNEDLTQRVCNLQKVRGLVQLAYANETLPQSQNSNVNNSFSSKYRLVAGILLFVGVFIGWYANQTYHSGYSSLNIANNARIIPANKKNETWQVMLHVSNNDPRRFDVLLSETEYLLESHKNNNQPIKIELLANGKGINLLKAGASSQAKRLNMLTKKYNNLMLSVCGKTLQRLQQDTGNKITLLPKTNIVRSAINQVTKRQKEGWSYIRI
jgi:hypothetical protein